MRVCRGVFDPFFWRVQQLLPVKRGSTLEQGAVMNDARNDGRSSSIERTGFAALWAFLLSPIIAQGLFRPLRHIFGPAGDAGMLTGETLALSAVVVLAQVLRAGRAPWLPLLLGGLVAGAASLGLSLGLPGLVSLLGVAAAMTWLRPANPQRRVRHRRDGVTRAGLRSLRALGARVSGGSRAAASPVVSPTAVTLAVNPAESTTSPCASCQKCPGGVLEPR